jgi:hypothetical protein
MKPNGVYIGADADGFVSTQTSPRPCTRVHPSAQTSSNFLGTV